MAGLLRGHDELPADGERGDAFVLESVAGMLADVSGPAAGGWSRWQRNVTLQVRLPGQPVYYASPRLWMTRDKYPVIGTIVPVVVDRADPSHVVIAWDDVPTIDELVRTNPVFTDPDAAERSWQEANKGWLDATVAQADAGAAAYADRTAPGAGDQVKRALAGVRATLPDEQHGLQRQQIDGASARVISYGCQYDLDSFAYWIYGEMLLSVSVPGQTRYGARWHGLIPQTRVIDEWWDLPVEVHPRHPDKIKVKWDEAGGFDVIADKMRAANDSVAARVQQGFGMQQATPDSYAPLIAAIADPEQRARAQAAIAEALGHAQPAAAPPAPDPYDELARLGGLRDSGQMSEEDFAAAKARILSNL